MALIGMCWYSTKENKKFEIAKKCMSSLLETVDLTKHRLIVINQNSMPEATEWLSQLAKVTDGVTVINLSENIGTARGINLAMKQRNEDEFFIKSDDDLAWLEKGWVDKMEREIIKNPLIGILGLKRDDVYGEMVEDKSLLWCHDIFGTCTMYNPLMLDKVGHLVQWGSYGYDDSTMSVRSEAAGFRNAFMRHIKIENLDLKETPYTEWKRRQAGIHAQEAGLYMSMVKSGELSYYYDGE